ncbi:MAG: GNAT family N-acetyltransferase [Oscillospiraceae bacterium]|nr:GNAT family N-acetyltransferase [Oscillospiraceae bacterium]
MNHVVIKAYETYHEPEILLLYKSVGWSAYYTKPEILRQAFEGSLCVYGAYLGERLVGLIRVVGDGQTIIFIQDVLVHPDYQRQGIGTMLIGQIKARYHRVRQMHLLTDDTPRTVGFYKSAGFIPVEDAQCRAFTKR